MAKKTTISKLEQRDRDLKALELRKHGATFDAIATQLDYSSRAHAFGAITKLLNSQETEAVDDYRKLELMRLDAAELAIAKQVQAGNFGAIDRLIKIIAERSKLLGLYAAEKKDITSDGEKLQTPIVFLPAISDDVSDDS